MPWFVLLILVCFMLGLKELPLREIVNALVTNDSESQELYYAAMSNESRRGVANGESIFQWNCRYNTILKIAEKYNLNYAKLKRGNLWEAVYVIGPENEIYVFFSSKNLRSIIRNGNANHYLKLLNLFNASLDNLPSLTQQTSMNLDDDSNKSNSLKVQAEEVVKMMETNPSKVIVIAFDNTFISNVNAYVFNSKNEVVWEKNLASLVESDYKFVLTSDKVIADQKDSRVESNLKKKLIVRLK